jgi:hypothetical protein
MHLDAPGYYDTDREKEREEPLDILKENIIDGSVC